MSAKTKPSPTDEFKLKYNSDGTYMIKQKVDLPNGFWTNLKGWDGVVFIKRLYIWD